MVTAQYWSCWTWCVRGTDVLCFRDSCIRESSDWTHRKISAGRLTQVYWWTSEGMISRGWGGKRKMTFLCTTIFLDAFCFLAALHVLPCPLPVFPSCSCGETWLVQPLPAAPPWPHIRLHSLSCCRRTRLNTSTLPERHLPRWFSHSQPLLLPLLVWDTHLWCLPVWIRTCFGFTSASGSSAALLSATLLPGFPSLHLDLFQKPYEPFPEHICTSPLTPVCFTGFLCL